MVDYYRDKIYDSEPADDFMAGALTAGMADGTLALSDSDYDKIEEDDDCESPSNSILSLRLTQDWIASILGPVTSTPAIAKKCKQANGRTKAVKATTTPTASIIGVGDFSTKVGVHDGVGLRNVTICDSDEYLDMLEKIAMVMKRPNRKIELAYEAPWSAKQGTKKCVTYLTNGDELEEFWSSYVGYVTKLATKKEKPSEMKVSGILFINVMDGAGAQVCMSHARNTTLTIFRWATT